MGQARSAGTAKPWQAFLEKMEPGGRLSSDVPGSPGCPGKRGNSVSRRCLWGSDRSLPWSLGDRETVAPSFRGWLPALCHWSRRPPRKSASSARLSPPLPQPSYAGRPTLSRRRTSGLRYKDVFLNGRPWAGCHGMAR